MADTKALIATTLQEHWPYGIAARCRCGKTIAWRPTLYAHIAEIIADGLKAQQAEDWRQVAAQGAGQQVVLEPDDDPERPTVAEDGYDQASL